MIDYQCFVLTEGNEFPSVKHNKSNKKSQTFSFISQVV